MKPELQGTAGAMQHRLQLALEEIYGLRASEVSPVHAGTASDNFAVSDASGLRWFAKVYRAQADLSDDAAAIDLAGFARADGLPVPQLHRTLSGETIGRTRGLALSLWDFVQDAETAEAGLTGARWAAVGAVVGHLHRRLAGHPVAQPTRRSATDLVDVEAATTRYDRLISAYRTRPPADEFQAWALEAARERRALLPRAHSILEKLPLLSVQILHGDLATPNLLLRGDDVAALIDFQPPSPHFVSWEIARIACDPRTIVTNDDWMTSLPTFLDAYRDANPAAEQADLAAAVAVGCAYTLASTYPLAEPLQNPHQVTEDLQDYGRARHRAALTMLDSLAG